jgi:hypothetical protein
MNCMTRRRKNAQVSARELKAGTDLQTKLLRGRAPRADDEFVLQVISASAPGSGKGSLQVVGILDEQGRLYREVYFYEPVELLHFKARMNAAGFHHVAGDLFGLRRCGTVFYKPASLLQDYQQRTTGAPF